LGCSVCPQAFEWSRLTPLASTLTWAGAVAPHAEQIAKTLAVHAGIAPPPSALTGQSRRSGCLPTDRVRTFQAPTPPAVRTCQDCGTPLPTNGKRCRLCHQSANAERVRTQQADETARRRVAGAHPSERPTVRARIADTKRAQWAARRAASSGSGFTGTPSEFRRLILPRLATIAPRDLARETGLSRGYCARIRDGKRVPHVRHWAALQLVGLQAETPKTLGSSETDKTGSGH
jgi:hypothetical protein